jgi:hypothetical protein
MNEFLKFDVMARNVEMLMGGHFDATYSDSRGPIQIIHQIERVRSSPFFENNDFYHLIVEGELKRGGSFNPLDRALDVVDANVRGWAGQMIDRKVELSAAGRYHQDFLTMGDLVWTNYLHFQTGGKRDRAIVALEEYFKVQVREDDGNFYHVSDFSVNMLEGKTIKLLQDAAVARLKEVS